MKVRYIKRRIYSMQKEKLAASKQSAEELMWLNISPAGREFGSKDFELLEVIRNAKVKIPVFPN